MKTFKQEKDKETIDIFYGFWKHLGVMGVFFFGLALFYWGGQIMINDWGRIIKEVGWIGNLALAPLAAGTVLAWMSFAEFLRIIRE